MGKKNCFWCPKTFKNYFHIGRKFRELFVQIICQKEPISNALKNMQTYIDRFAQLTLSNKMPSFKDPKEGF